jgi:hypothetical protein
LALGVVHEDFFRTDCADEDSIAHLRQAIEREAARMLSTLKLFPGEWWAVK